MNLTPQDTKSIANMIDNGWKNGQICLKFPGLRKEQIAKIRANINPATPETKAKLKFDPIKNLYDNGFIDSGDLISAERIKVAWLIITADVRGSNASLEAYVDNTRKTSGMEESEFNEMVQQQYNIWHDECFKKKIKTGPIIHVLTEPVSFGDTDRYFGHKNGMAKELTIQALKLYSKLF